MIKKILLASSLIILFASNAFAGMSCKYDYWGNYNCTGTGNDSGYSSTTTTDYWGNDNTTDSYGNSYSCSYDYWGNYNCN